MIPEMVAATRNPGKLAELSAALAGLAIKLISLAEYPGAPEVVEDGETFVANAEKKARIISLYANKFSVADDSGLEVDALGGAPGVYSALYAGVHASDEENNRKLLAELARRPEVPRTARFVCVIAVCSPQGEILLASGEAKGVILSAPRGSNGFGYDPLFYYPPLGATFAELSLEEKLKVSHRGRALQELARKLPGWLKSRC